MTRDPIQEQIDAAWLAHEGDRDPGISDLEWQQHSTRHLRSEVQAGPRPANGKTARRMSRELERAA